MDIFDELVIDSFAGGGGTSEGIKAALGRDPDIAVNHDRFALAMHRINHPNTRHLVEDVLSVDAISMCEGKPVGMLWMSPDCKDHSKAKGGKPRDKNIRGLAWACFGWVKALPAWQRPRVVFLENVEEFREWGPLLENGKRCPVQKGAIFQQFIAAWRAIGYSHIEWRERRAWKTGAGTIRKRLYVIMRRDGEVIVWPEPTHGDPNVEADAQAIAAGQLKPWKRAADCIDWSIPCPSIFATSAEIKELYGVRAIRPLKKNTMARLAKGTHRYVLTNPKPFIVSNAIAEPLRTITSAHRGEHAVVAPYLAPRYQEKPGQEPRTRSVETPAATIMPRGNVPGMLVTPYLVPRYRERDGQEPRTRSVQQPMGTVVPDGNEGSLAAVYLAKHNFGDKPCSAADEPLHTVTTQGNRFGVTAAFLARHFGGHETPGAHNAVVAAHMVNLRGTERRDAPADVPVNTLSAQGNHAAAAVAFLSKYYGEGMPNQSAGEPLHTVTAKPRFGVVEALAALPPFGPEHYERARKVADFLRAHGYWDDREFVTVEIDGVPLVLVDIGMRMLTPRERFNAQGFRPDYIITHGILEDGSEIRFTAEQQGYMCGNSVCPTEAEALIGANYRPRKVQRPRRYRPRPIAPLLEAAE